MILSNVLCLFRRFVTMKLCIKLNLFAFTSAHKSCGNLRGHFHSKSPHIRTYFFESGSRRFFLSKELRPVSRYKGSCWKDASCRPFQSLTKILTPIICVGSVLVDLIPNGGYQTLKVK